MASAGVLARQRWERQLFVAAAILFPLIIVAGFARTYYLTGLIGGPPVKSTLVHVHGAVMTMWVLLFVAQIALIRTGRRAVHMALGLYGAALAVVAIVTGFFVAAAAAKFGSDSTPPDIPPLEFMIVPTTDLLLFAGLFGAALYFRRRPAEHKRLMLLTAVNFLPPALARLPLGSITAATGPLIFFGLPIVLVIALLVYDTRRTGTLNRVFLLSSLILIASYPVRVVASTSQAWLSFAAWVTGWAA